MYASFITGITATGTLGFDSLESGYYAFIRLVGTIYFKKHSTGFNTQSPENFNEPGLSIITDGLMKFRLYGSGPSLKTLLPRMKH